LDQAAFSRREVGKGGNRHWSGSIAVTGR
jgi:hypothetical protein